MTDKSGKQSNDSAHQGEEPGKTGGKQDAHSSRTSGTNRDFDDKQQSVNQGHGHPREERGDNR